MWLQAVFNRGSQAATILNLFLNICLRHPGVRVLVGTTVNHLCTAFLFVKLTSFSLRGFVQFHSRGSSPGAHSSTASHQHFLHWAQKPSPAGVPVLAM